jgi:U4/U6.U5 tri-snRNP-associated protein 2
VHSIAVNLVQAVLHCSHKNVFRIHCKSRHGLPQVEENWYEVQDLRVTDILPQMVALSESYMQLWSLRTEDVAKKAA